MTNEMPKLPREDNYWDRIEISEADANQVFSAFVVGFCILGGLIIIVVSLIKRGG